MNKTELLPDRPGIPPMAQLPEPEAIDVPALARACAAGDIDLICVLGPTASGKTNYAVRLARTLRGLCPLLSPAAFSPSTFLLAQKPGYGRAPAGAFASLKAFASDTA